MALSQSQNECHQHKEGDDTVKKVWVTSQEICIVKNTKKGWGCQERRDFKWVKENVMKKLSESLKDKKMWSNREIFLIWGFKVSTVLNDDKGQGVTMDESGWSEVKVEIPGMEAFKELRAHD